MPDTWITPRIWVAGERVSASKMNEISNNLRVLFPITAVNQMMYANATNSLAVVLKTQIPGLLHTKGKVDFNPGGQSFAGGWADITGATFTLTLTHTCTIVVRAVVSGYNGGAGRSFFVRAMVNAVADPGTVPFFNGGAVRNEALPYFYYTTGVTAGSRIVKLQCQADTDPNVVDRGRLEAFAYVE